MAVAFWAGELVVFLAAWKIAHILYWNMRRLTGVRTLPAAMVATLAIGVAGVTVANLGGGVLRTVFFALLLGVSAGEYEFNRASARGD